MHACELLLAVLILAASRPAGAATDFPFVLNTSGEAVADIMASSPGSSWQKTGAEAAVATIELDGSYDQDVVIHRGPDQQTYSVFLGPIAAGRHRLHIERSPRWSAAGAGLEVRTVSVHVVAAADPEYQAIEHAPIVYARADTLGHFSDVPMVMWYERLRDGADQVLQYSLLFSNEDSGTPTDALMARWGRASDIEYIYRVTLGSNGEIKKEIFQGMEHDDRPFQGSKIGRHPLILVATPNNCFADTGFSPVQYRLLPVYLDLSQHSREELMDRFPFTYSIMAQELAREHKIRPFGATDGNAISDPRNYLYFEIEAENQQAGLAIWVKLRGEPRMYSSHRGRLGLVISRSGWYRTTVELPPNTKPESIEYFAIECVDLRDPYLLELGEGPPLPNAESTLRNISKAFLLDAQYKPAKSIFELHRSMTLHPGDLLAFVPGAADRQ
jgi:hypothetical protein